MKHASLYEQITADEAVAEVNLSTVALLVNAEVAPGFKIALRDMPPMDFDNWTMGDAARAYLRGMLALLDKARAGGASL
jgi:hypothetical protein